ncbi:PP2C family protein-serine/threonine phosphatase [Candidatus Latescibacterota bacterium]
MKDECKTKAQLIAELLALRDQLQAEGADLARRLAMERVRAEAMSMTATDDLAGVVRALFEEMQGLEILSETEACNVFLIRGGGDAVRCYVARANPRRWGMTCTSDDLVDPEQDILISVFDADHGDVFDDIIARWRQQTPWCFLQDYSVDVVRRIAANLGSEPTDAYLSAFIGERQIHNVPFEHGVVGWSDRADHEEHIAIVHEMASALSLGYVRFLDFEKVSEAQTRLIHELEDELQKAHDMQMGLMPTASPDLEGVSIAGSCTTANGVGGDFYQYFQQDDGITISLADVTGHSMEAAIPAVMFSGILDNQMEQPKPLPELFQSLNRSLCRSLGEHTYVCLSMLDLDPTNRSMKVANCGCPYPLLYRQDTGQIEEIQIEAYPLGIRPDTEYSATEIALSPGDYVVLHSDGFSEATNSQREMFGFDRTMEVIRQGCSEGLSPGDLIERLIGEVKAFTGDEPQADDMTCVVIKVEA